MLGRVTAPDEGRGGGSGGHLALQEESPVSLLAL